MTIRYSPLRLAIMRRLFQGPAPLSEWRQWDQRVARAMFLARIFTLDRRLSAVITPDGWNQYSQIMRGKPALRKNHNRPTFVESSDNREFKHLRRAN